MSPGILLIAHGSRSHEWVSYIELAARAIACDLPIEISFLELVPRRSIPEGIMRFEAVGVKEIIVIPLFITMGSTHLDEIQYALGIIPNPTIETELTPIPHSSNIIWCSPLEDHPLVLEILEERIHDLSISPEEEWLLLIGHGSDVPGFQEKWEGLLQSLCTSLGRSFGFKGASYATLHPDTIRSMSMELSKSYRVITIPVFLSEGYFTRHSIPRKLVGNIYNGRTLLPHSGIAKWLEEMIQKGVDEVGNLL